MSGRRCLDLTHPVREGMPVFPGTEPPEIREACTFSEHGFRERRLALHSHTGTHIDAPSHMVADGISLDSYPASHFLGRARVLKVNPHQEKIDLEHLRQLAADLVMADYLLLASGWDRYWGAERYYRGFPVLTAEAAKWLLQFPLKGIGVDTISVDAMDSQDFPVHMTLLGENRVIVENLTGISCIPGEWCDFLCMPLNIHEGDGAPVRAVAIIDTVEE